MKNPMLQLIERREKGHRIGIYSACTANEYVIETVLEAALDNDIPALVEATANQSNQFGGYTGMKPADFRDYVYDMAERMNFPKDRLILGGDHLGPLTGQLSIDEGFIYKKFHLSEANEAFKLFKNPSQVKGKVLLVNP